MRYLLLLAGLCCLPVGGCRRAVPAPPVERNDLVVRFFRSLRSSGGEAAAMQGEKLYQMDKRNYFLLKLISIQQANGCILAAQEHLNSGRLEEAIGEMEKGLERFPENTVLRKQLGLLRKLRHAEKLLMAMRTAPNPTAMNSALMAARAGLDGIDSPGLREYFQNYRKSIDRWTSSPPPGADVTGRVPIRSFDDK